MTEILILLGVTLAWLTWVGHSLFIPSEKVYGASRTNLETSEKETIMSAWIRLAKPLARRLILGLLMMLCMTFGYLIGRV